MYVVPKPNPHYIEVRGDNATIATGRYISINSFGEYYLEQDARSDMKKTGHLTALASKPMLKFVHNGNGYVLVLCDSIGNERAKRGRDGVWCVQAKATGGAVIWERNDKLRATWE